MNFKITDEMSQQEKLLREAYNVLGRMYESEFSNPESAKKVEDLYAKIDCFFIARGLERVRNSINGN